LRSSLSIKKTAKIQNNQSVLNGTIYQYLAQDGTSQTTVQASFHKPEQEKQNSGRDRKHKMVESERKKVTHSVPVYSPHHTTHISVTASLGHGRVPRISPLHIPQEMRCSPLQAYIHPTRGTLGISAVSRAAEGLAGRRKLRVPPRPHTTAQVLFPYQMQPASP